jgi:hypothetical protein
MLDKFWFFGSFEYQKDWDSQPGADPAYPSKSDARRMFWKFNYNISDKHRLLNGYHDDFYWIPGTTSPFNAPSTNDLSHGHNPTPNLVYTGVLTSRTLVEARYSGFWLQSSRDPNEDGQSRIGVRYTDDVTGMVSGAITQWTESRSWRYGVQGKLSHYAENVLGGSHDLKVGLQYGTNGNVSLNGPNDTIRLLTSGRRTGTTQLPYYQGTRALTWGTYVDDTFRIGDRTTLNAGVRYDYSKGYYPSFPMLDRFGVPTGEVSAANDDVYHFSVVSPRVGVNIRVAGQTVVKGHYGRYYSALERDFSAIVPSTTPEYTFDIDAAGNRSNFTSQAPANLRVDPNRRNPYSDQYIVQVEQGVAENVGLQVNYVHKRGEDFNGWQDVTGQYVQVPYVDGTGIDATGETVTVWRLVSPPNDRIFLLTTPDGLYTRYNGVTFMLTKRMSHNWLGVISLVLSKADGRIASSARSGPSTAQTSAAGTFGRDTAGPNDYVNTEGRLIGDKPVVAKAQLVYSFPWGITASANVQHQTGRLWSRQVRPAGLGFPSPPTINMESNTGDRRVPDVDLLDLRVQKTFGLGGSGTRLDVFLDGLNMTNSDSSESVASQLGTAAATAFGVPTKFTYPRRLQLGAKIRW